MVADVYSWTIDANEFNAIMDKYTRETIEEQLESAITSICVYDVIFSLVKKEIEAKKKSQVLLVLNLNVESPTYFSHFEI